MSTETRDDAQHMGDKERFCRSFEWSADIAWSAEQGILIMDRERRAAITLRMTINGDASSMHVAIVHKRKGTIAERSFIFGDYLSKEMAHRKDERADYMSGLYAARLGGPLHWYIAEPKTTKPFTSAVEAYIDLWR